MGSYHAAFVAFDVAKLKHAVAVAEGDRSGEVRFLGEIENRPKAVERTIRKLAGTYDRLHVCFEAGPTRYGLYRQVLDLGRDCMVVAPALIPKRPGERVKTNRRDAVTLAAAPGRGVDRRLGSGRGSRSRSRSGPGPRAGADDLRRKRQQLLSFLLRHGRIYDGGGHWTLAHRRWLAGQAFEHTAQQIVFQEKLNAIREVLSRMMLELAAARSPGA